MPVFHHVGFCRAAYGDEMLCALGEEGEYVGEVEHPKARILAGDVEVRKIVHGRGRRQRIPRAHTPVGGADDEAIEFALVPPDPKRQHEQVPEHGEHRTSRPTRGGD